MSMCFHKLIFRYNLVNLSFYHNKTFKKINSKYIHEVEAGSETHLKGRRV